MQNSEYYLGCPEWGNSYWSKNFFAPKSRSRSQNQAKTTLEQYASVFNTVEGNTSFYGIPRRENLIRWRAAVPESFRFCFKFPREISHERRLRDSRSPLQAFLGAMRILEGRLGPCFLQLPPSFSAAEFEILEDFLRSLPSDFKYCVELRHQDFFDMGDAESALEELLQELEIGRVFFDSRVLHGSNVQDEDTRVAKSRKPKIPVRQELSAGSPFLRFIGSNDFDESQKILTEWAQKTAEWIRAGHKPYIFIHTPNDHHAPQLARKFHELLRQHVRELAPLPSFPIERLGPRMETPSLFG